MDLPQDGFLGDLDNCPNFLKGALCVWHLADNVPCAAFDLHPQIRRFIRQPGLLSYAIALQKVEDILKALLLREGHSRLLDVSSGLSGCSWPNRSACGLSSLLDGLRYGI